jgi:hypothetical protein
VHQPKNEDLNDGQRNEILDRYLTMKNKLSFQYFKGELDGMRQEKENAALVL